MAAAGGDSRMGSKSRRPGGDGSLSFLTEPLDVEQAREAAAAQGGPGESEHSVRRKGLVEEAEIRAEQQALARKTMLSLADALDEASKVRRRVELELLEERQRSAQLRGHLEACDLERRKALKAREDARVAHVQERFLASTKKGGGASVWLMLSRQVNEVSAIGDGDPSNLDQIEEGDDAAQTEEEDDFPPPWNIGSRELSLAAATPAAATAVAATPAAATAVAAAALATSAAPPALAVPSGGGPPALAGDGGEFKAAAPPARGARSQSSSPKGDPPRQLAKKGKRSKGDGMMMLWMLRGWREVIDELKQRRLQDAEMELKLKALRAEMAKMKEGYKKQLTEEKAKSRALEGRISQLLDEIEKLKMRCDQLEREKAELAKKMNTGVPDNRPYEELLEKYKKLQEMYENRGLHIEQLKEEIRDLERTLAKEREESAKEIANLKAKIRELAAELTRQITFAKHLRDIALRAKRDAASSISPEKFAVLITELEDMRDKMKVIGSENAREAEQVKMMGLKLDQNKRRLELERQFLPLLHKVRGPVGPQNPLFQKNMAALAAAAMVPDDMGPGSPPDRLRMAHSQSVGALDPRGRPDPRASSGHRLQGSL